MLLPLGGEDGLRFRKPVEWAVDAVNRAGGVGGRNLRLVLHDTGKEDTIAAAAELAADDRIIAVIGPETSTELYAVAGLFIAAKKPLVSPSATAAGISRAFAGSPYVWRTAEPDIAQVRALLLTAARGGARSVALLAPDTIDGGTFYDWFGFLGTELGLRVTATIRYRADAAAGGCGAPLGEALASRPDALIAVPGSPAQAACVVQGVRSAAAASSGRGSATRSPRLLFSDVAHDPATLQALGGRGGGSEGTAPTPLPGNGFAAAFRERFGGAPPTYAANAYDALVLLAYGLQRSNGAGGVALGTALRQVVAARGATTGWDEQGVAAALRAIAAAGSGQGALPDVTGAATALAFDPQIGIDPVSGAYAVWRVQHGAFVDREDGSSGAGGEFGVSAVRGVASERLRRAVTGTSSRPVGMRTGLWAVLIATSYGSENARHQADVLAQYQLLRARGVADSHIILISAGDAGASTGGVVRNAVGGPNLAAGAQIDYRLDQVDPEALLDILGGRARPGLPTVVESGPGDDVYLAIAGHGAGAGVLFGVRDAVPPPGSHVGVLTPAALSAAIDAMAAAHRYRRLLITVEACQGGALGEALQAPNALLLSAANPFESSLSANYDAATGTWLADQFSYALWTIARADPAITLDALQRRLYDTVSGAHVSAYGPNFGNAAAVSVSEFLTP